MLPQNDSVLLQFFIPWELNNQTIRSRHQSFFRLIFEKWNYEGWICETNTRKYLKILFTSNYWYLCQNSCSWTMFWKEDQRICCWNLWKMLCRILSINFCKNKYFRSHFKENWQNIFVTFSRIWPLRGVWLGGGGESVKKVKFRTKIFFR